MGGLAWRGEEDGHAVRCWDEEALGEKWLVKTGVCAWAGVARLWQRSFRSGAQLEQLFPALTQLQFLQTPLLLHEQHDEGISAGVLLGGGTVEAFRTRYQLCCKQYH